MAPKSRHGRFDAWVEIAGERAEEFELGVDGRTTTRLIKSRVGAVRFPFELQ